MEKPDYYKGLTFIEGVEDLKCQNIIRDIAYFTNMQSTKNTF